MDQMSFNGAAPPIISANEPHMALLFLCDTSGSMEGKPIAALNEAINRFKGDVCKDNQTQKILDVGIIEFNDAYNVTMEFAPISQLEPVHFEASGRTFLSEPLDVALDMVTERSRFYRRTSTEPYKPWIFIMTDGLAMDSPEQMNAIYEKVSQMTEQGKVAVWSLACGEALEDRNVMDMLHRICGKRVLRLENHDFTGFFDWVHKSMRAVSQSSPGEKAKGQALPSSITIDVSDLM